MTIANYDEVIEALQPYLSDYLIEKGILEIKGKNFNCLNPNHEDKDPSMGIVPDGKIAHCFGCLPGEQLIRTLDGLKPIKDLKINETIFLADGSIGKIINYVIHDNNNNMYQFELDSIRNDHLFFTSNHEMLTIKDVQQKVPYIKSYDNKIRFIQQLKGKKLSYKYKNKLNIDIFNADKVTEGDYFIFPCIKPSLSISHIDNIWLRPYTSGPKNNRITSIPINTDTMWLFGIFCAEGNVYRGGINFSLNFNETDYAQRIALIIKTYFNKNVTIDPRQDKNILCVRCSSTDLEVAFKELFGTGCANKKAPYNFCLLDLSLQKAFLQGVNDGDGNTKQGLITTTSLHLVSLLQQIATNLSYHWSLTKKSSYTDRNGIFHRISYLFYINKKENLKAFYDFIGQQKFLFLRIKKIYQLPPVQKVYDITVQGNNNFNNTFLCQYYAVHNCGFTLNLFQACALLEDKPANGPRFIDETLRYLAEKYQIPIIDGTPLTEEQVYELDTYKAYRSAHELITNGAYSEAFQKAIDERGWTPEICKEFGIGTVYDYDEFRKQLRSLGFSAGFLDDIDLSRKDIFDNNKMIFTVCNEKGIPVGFASRNLSYTPDKQNGSKYVNQRTTGVKCNIYRKSERLYGFDRVLKKNGKKHKQVYLFEGYPDVVTAAFYGLDNCVAIGGTALTIDQIYLLKEFGYYDLIICLDGDSAGRERVASFLDTILGGHRDLKIQIVIPPEEKDPDQFIREKGIDEFLNLKKWTAFEWRLAEFSDETDSEDICKAMIPLIVNETSYITKETMCETLAKTTGVTLKSILSELNRLQDLKEAERSRERQNIINQMTRELEKDPDNAEVYLQSTENALYELTKKYQEDAFSETSCLSLITKIKENEEAKDGSFSGFILGPDLQDLENALCGNWQKDIWFCIGGRPNSGKTSLMCKLIYEIANHQENDACVIYHTIDDTVEQVLPKFVCIAQGGSYLTLNEVMDPNYHKSNIADERLRNLLIEYREIGYQAIQKLIKDGRLIIKDVNDGCTLAYADRLIRYYKQKFPNRKIVYVLDNFHKLQDSTSKGDIRARFKDLSSAMKHLVTKWHILGVSTVEYRKISSSKAGNEDVAETVQIEYDANIVAHVHNELHNQRDKATHVHYTTSNDGERKRLPRIEFEIGKNKVTAFKETIWLDFWPASSNFKCVSIEKVIADANAEKKKITEDFEEQHELFRNAVQECIDKGYKIGKAKYICQDEHGFSPQKEWWNEFKNLQQE